MGRVFLTILYAINLICCVISATIRFSDNNITDGIVWVIIAICWFICLFFSLEEH